MLSGDALRAIAAEIDASWAANGRAYEDALGALEAQMGYVAPALLPDS